MNTAEMMKIVLNKFFMYLAVLIVLFTGACNPDDRPIIPGIYEERVGDERVVVSSTSMQLYLKSRTVKSLEGRHLNGEYRYSVNKNNKIRIRGSSNDFAFTEFNWYDWYWRDGKILRIERKTGEKAWFVRTSGADGANFGDQN